MSSLEKRLGARIRGLRLARGLSQEQLGERASVSYKFIGDVERGNGNPTVRWLDAVARGLNVTLKDLIVDEEPPAMQYPPLSGRAYSAVREARNSLEGILRQYGAAPDEKPAKTRYRRPARPRAKRR